MCKLISERTLWIASSRAFFWIFFAFLSYATLIPSDHKVGVGGLTGWDKADHFLSFYILMLTAIIGHPRLGVIKIGLMLCAFGGAIEVLQVMIGRQADLVDWISDILGVFCVVSPILLYLHVTDIPSKDNTDND